MKTTHAKRTVSDREYATLKAEQLQRISAPDQLVNFTVVSVGVAASVGAQSDRLRIAWLVIPWVAAAFGWAWVHTDDKVTAIAHWLTTTDGRTDAETDTDAGLQPVTRALSWEQSAKGLLPPRLRRAGDRVAFGIVFVAPAPVAVGFFVAGWIGEHGWHFGTGLVGAPVAVVECAPAVAVAAVYAYSTRQRCADVLGLGSGSAA